MAKQRYIQIKKSKHHKMWYWIMKGGNGEKMAHSEYIQNRTYLKQLMADFENIGFKIIWGDFNK